MPKTVTIRIGFNGVVNAETHGMKGEECLGYIEKLETMLEAEAVESRYTDEFYETASSSVRNVSVDAEQVRHVAEDP
jgi:hypothetical protein